VVKRLVVRKMSVYSIVLLGGTGDGKSTCGNQICMRLGLGNCPFSESASCFSHTSKPSKAVINRFTVVDTPGLLDTGGQDEDIINLKAIVRFCQKELSHVNTFLLVVNYLRRFDHGLQV
jgi:putative ribosome biogenesis GTPase RsgA